MILSMADILAKSTPIVGGVVITATFNDNRNFETISNVHFLDCTIRKGIRLSEYTFINCIFYNTIFSCDMLSCKFINCRFKECRFWQIGLNGIALKSSKIVNSHFRYCFLNAVTGGTISDCELYFCDLSNHETKLKNCRFTHVAINEPDTDNNY